MLSKTRLLALLPLVFTSCIPSCLAADGVPGDILLSGAGDEDISGGRVTSIAGYVLLPKDQLGPQKTQAIIVVLTPKNQPILGSGVESSMDGTLYKGVTPMDVQINGAKDYKNIKKVKLKYDFDGHKKTALIEKHKFSWSKTKIFLVVYDKNWKSSSYALTNNFKGAYIPKKTLTELQKRFPKGINTPSPF